MIKIFPTFAFSNNVVIADTVGTGRFQYSLRYIVLSRLKPGCHPRCILITLTSRIYDIPVCETVLVSASSFTSSVLVLGVSSILSSTVIGSTEFSSIVSPTTTFDVDSTGVCTAVSSDLVTSAGRSKMHTNC